MNRLRYITGNDTPVMSRLRQSYGRELRFIPGSGPVVQTSGDCIHRIYRHVFPVAELTSSVTGQENQAWQHKDPGLYSIDWIGINGLTNFGDAYGLNGVRFECRDTLLESYWQNFPLSGTDRQQAQKYRQTDTQFLNYARHEFSTAIPHRPEAGIEDILDTSMSSLSPAALANSAGYRASMMGDAVSPLSHIVPTTPKDDAVQYINAPNPFSVVAPQSLPSDYGVYLTHVRAVINNEVAGPLVVLGDTVTKTQVIHNTSPEEVATWTVNGLYLGGCNRGTSHHDFPNGSPTGQFFLTPQFFVVPLSAGTRIGNNDIVGFDMWLRVVRENDRWGNAHGQASSPYSGAYPLLGAVLHDWPFKLHTTPRLTVSQPDATENEKKNNTYASWEAGNASVNYHSSRHTYELDFGATYNDKWTPDVDDTERQALIDDPDRHVVIKMETKTDLGLTVSNYECFAYLTKRTTTDDDEDDDEFDYRLGIDWRGETACVRFDWSAEYAEQPTVAARSDWEWTQMNNTVVPLLYNQPTGNRRPYNILETGYYPAPTTSAAWNANYIQSFDVHEQGLSTHSIGPFNQAGTTHFKLAYVKFEGFWAAGNGDQIRTVHVAPHNFTRWNTNPRQHMADAIGSSAPPPEWGHLRLDADNASVVGPWANVADTITVTRVNR